MRLAWALAMLRQRLGEEIYLGIWLRFHQL